MRFSCRHHACIKSGIQKKVVGHTSTCARGVDGLKNQQIYVLPADPQLVGKAEQVMERCDQGNLNQLPEDDPGRPTIVSASPNSSVHETFEIEHAPTIL